MKKVLLLCSMFVVAAWAMAQTPRPAGVTEGIFYDKPNKGDVTVSFYAADKSGNVPVKIFILSSLSGWAASNDYLCNQDGGYFWYTFKGLQPGKEFAFQYYAQKTSGAVRFADPYSTKVLHNDDQWEPKKADPTLMPYPTKDLLDENGKQLYPRCMANGYLTVLHPNKPEFPWSNATKNFKRPNKNNLVIYEAWVYDFSPKRTYRAMVERLDYLKNLGINALELMPVSEFEGNKSWGYNPTYYCAVDKAYGSEWDFKILVDECHKRGIAVIVDMVFNHATGLQPWNALWGKTKSPYMLPNYPHGDEFFEEFNHNYKGTRDYFTYVLKHWLTELKVDGFRLDLAHGLSGETYKETDVVINLRNLYNNGVKAVSSDAYMILEYWRSLTAQCVKYGMMCWDNQTTAFYKAAEARGSEANFNNVNRDNYVTYAASHDEQRPAWKAYKYGLANQQGSSATAVKNRLKRVPSVVAWGALLNGPQMIWMFDEMGYDYSHCSNPSGTAGNENDKGVKPCYETDGKPVPEAKGWYEDADRMAAYKKVGQIIQLRTRLAPSVFEGNPTSSDVASGRTLRSVIWGEGTSRIFAIVNQGESAQSFTLPTGNSWYDYLAGSPSAMAAGTSISLPAGDMKVYTAKKFTLPTIPDSYTAEDFVYVGVEDVVEDGKLASLYPSMATDFVTVTADEQITAVQLMALSGKVYKPAYTEDGLVDVAPYEPGLYLLVVRFETFERAFKVIKL